ncbi:MAG: hypothetical protein K0S74_448 [Chlamydiales bacterium]|jgi:segregation and condensation protein B|nr:hypothetical protein [Chlamydiales bacterium]
MTTETKSFPFTPYSEEQAIRQRVKSILEALLFASKIPLSLDQIQQVTGKSHPFDTPSLIKALEELQQEFQHQQRAIQIEQVAGGFIFKTKPEYAEYVGRLQHIDRPMVDRLSNAATEVLAIIAYRQPITRSEIDAIRGVDSSGALTALIEKELVVVVGKKEAVGRPSLYGVTDRFLHHFGLKDLSTLPFYSELSRVVTKVLPS